MHVTLTIYKRDGAKTHLHCLYKAGVLSEEEYASYGQGKQEGEGGCKSLTEYTAVNFLIAYPHYSVKMEVLDCVY